MRRILFIIILLFSNYLFGQYYFGKNKIQPFDYDWAVLSSPHFDIYYYSAESELAEMTAQIAEQTWARLTAHFRFAPMERIPIILYSSPALFSETHTIPYIIPEGVGGFTEYIKGRVVIPFDGSLSRFEHILPHELVHIWQLHYNEFLHDAHQLFFMDFMPLWFTEGQAELLSQTEESVDERTEIISALANDRFVLPHNFSYIYGTYQMYKEGQNFLRFLSERYGKDTDVRLLERIWQHGWFDNTFHSIMGISLENAGLLWRQYLWEKFSQYIANRTPAKVVGKVITHDGYFFSPIQIDSNTIVCKGNRLGYSGIYLITNGKISPIRKMELTESAEATRLFSNKIAVYNDSLVVFSAKSQGKDKLFIKNIKTGKEKNFHIDGLVEISSPIFSADGNTVLFSACRLSGYQDIFKYNLATSQLVAITDDKYYDYSPAFLPDGKIIFCSDRFDKNRLGFCVFDPENDHIFEISLPSSIYRPRSISVHKNKIYFVADDDTFPDAYMINIHTDSIFKISNLTEPIYDLSCGNGDTILISRSNGDDVSIQKIVPDSIVFVGTIERESLSVQWQLPHISTSLSGVEKRKKPNAHRLSFDLAQGEMGMVSSQQAGGGLELALSDMMGDRRIYMFFANYAQSLDELLSEANFAVLYSIQGMRWIKSLGTFHFHFRSYDRYEGSFDERQIGLTAGVSYSFSRFTRLEGNSYVYYSDRGEWQADRRKDGIFSLNLSLIRDNSLWGITGPIDGMRANITAGAGIGASGVLYHYLVSMDFRHYFRITKRTCWAHRLILRHSDGKEPQRFYMGGTWDFRGYPYFYFFGKNQALFNSELRFPLLDRLYLKTPLIDISIGGIRGALFFDAGDAWENEYEIVGSYGVGARMSLGGWTVLRLDFAQTTDFKSIHPHWRWDIFFGWDF